MRKKYPVITLCGSTRFKPEFEKAQKDLTLEGYIVISVGLFGHSGDDEVWEGKSEDTVTKTKAMLDEMHKEKIDLAKCIYVINPGGYIGNSTWSEICYARMTKKDIKWLEEVPMNVVDGKVEDHIREAELLAWQSLDTVIHAGGFHNPAGHPFIRHKGEIIYDPWYVDNDLYNGEPLSGHIDGAQMEPFQKYGNVEMARFIEDIIAVRGGFR